MLPYYVHIYIFAGFGGTRRNSPLRREARPRQEQLPPYQQPAQGHGHFGHTASSQAKLDAQKGEVHG